MLRSLALAALVPALAPGAAHAVVGEQIVPFLDEADGVTVDRSGRTPVVRFARTDAASQAWRRISGRRSSVVCNSADGAGGIRRSRPEHGREDLFVMTAVTGPDQLGRLVRALGDELVRLAGPSSTPPAGSIGLWERAAGGDDLAVVTVSADGERLFVSQIDGVFSTNVPNAFFSDGPSLFP